MAFLKTKPLIITIISLLVVVILLVIPGSTSPNIQPITQSPPSSVATSSKPDSQIINQSRVMLDHWESEHGLPQNSVVDLARTKDGYLWIGTQEGVTRFDGIDFKNYKDHPGWANKSIFTNTIFASSDGSLWVGTRNGLDQIKNERFTAYTLESGLPDAYVSALAEDSEGSIWVGTRQGLSKLKNGRFTTLTSKDGLIDDDIRNVAITRDGSIWVGTEKGLTHIKDGHFESFTEESGLSNNKVTKLFESHDGTLWISTERGGLSKYKDGVLSPMKIAGLTDNSVFSLAEDLEGRLWLGTGTGLVCLDGNRLINYSEIVKTLNDRIHSLLVDYEGILWIGTNGNGLFKVRTPKFTVYGEQEGIPRDDVWCVLEARDGSLWMGLGEGGGLARLKNGKIDSWSVKDGLPDSEVLSLYEAKDGKFWVGTGGGLCQFINGRFKCYTTKQGMAQDQVTAISESADGSMWIGTYKGVSRFKDGQFDNSWNEKGLGGSLIGDLSVMRDGSVWFVGMPGGAFRIKDGNIQNYSTAQGLPSDQTTCIYEDSAGDIWIGTYQNGVSRMRPDGKITTYSTQQGLLENQVFDTIEDGLGNFWLTSNHGIFRIAKQQFDDLDQGKIRRLSPIRYGLSDGMRSEECNGGSQPSSWKTRDGRILITTIRGIVAFNPREIPDEEFLLQASIQEVVADRFSVPLDADIQIGPGLQNLEIHYFGLSLIAPTKVQFKYMLENWDKDWVDVGSRRTAYYNNLPPGDYLFRVSVANSAGQWSIPKTGIPIHIKKRFYQSTWFYLLSTLLAGLILYATFRVRVSRLNEKLLSKITMSLPVAVGVVDNKDSVKLLNNQFIKELGYTMEDLSSMETLFELIYPDPTVRHQARLNWQKATSTISPGERRSIPNEWRISCKDGSEMDVEVRVAQAGERYVVTLNDITYRKRAEEALKASHEQLRELAARLQEAREEERAFIAREIHDELGQLLTGLKIDLKWFEKHLPQDAKNAKLHEKMVSILELVDETIRAMRRVATQFRPGVLDTLGLMAAIEWQAEEFSARTGIKCEFVDPLPQHLIGLECETALFRIFQESLTNVARHSEATKVKVSLIYKNSTLILRIHDNGRGITEKEIKDPHSIGLLGMRERAYIFGGEVSVTGNPGQGTTVTACIPINSKDDQHKAKSVNGSRAK